MMAVPMMAGLHSEIGSNAREDNLHSPQMHGKNSLFGPGRQGRTADHHSNGDTTLCDVEQLRLQSGKAKTLDDDVGEDT